MCCSQRLWGLNWPTATKPQPHPYGDRSAFLQQARATCAPTCVVQVHAIDDIAYCAQRGAHPPTERANSFGAADIIRELGWTHTAQAGAGEVRLLAIGAGVVDERLRDGAPCVQRPSRGHPPKADAAIAVHGSEVPERDRARVARRKRQVPEVAFGDVQVQIAEFRQRRHEPRSADPNPRSKRRTL